MQPTQMPIFEQDRLGRQDIDANIRSAAERLSATAEEPRLTERDADHAAHAVMEQMSSGQRKLERRLPDRVIGALLMAHGFTLLLLYYVLWRPTSTLALIGFTLFTASTLGGLLFLTTGRTVEGFAPEPPQEQQLAHKQRDHRGWLLQTLARRSLKLVLSASLSPFVAYLFVAKGAIRAYPVVVTFIRESETLQRRLEPLRIRITRRIALIRARVSRAIKRFRARQEDRRGAVKPADTGVTATTMPAPVMTTTTAEDVKQGVKAATKDVKESVQAAQEQLKTAVGDFVDVAQENAAVKQRQGAALGPKTVTTLPAQERIVETSTRG